MKNLIVGICDDVPEIIEQIYDMLEKYLNEKNNTVQLWKFQSGKAALEKIENIDILFLDIEMPDMDGIEVGKEIQIRNPDCKIIMATSKVERFKEAFKINAFRFVSKPFSEEEVTEALSDAMEKMIGFHTIELYEKRIPYDIQQREIQIIKAYGSSVEVLVGERCMRKEMTLTKLLEELDPRLFYQIDRSYVINMLHISRYRNGVIEMGDKKFTISRRRRKEFERIFQEFDITYGGK